MKTYTPEELRAILLKHSLWLLDKPEGERADLSYANLRYADLSYANLRYANLSSADLSYANLSSADLSSANLSSANLRYADLSYANLRYANLSSADLSYANLSSADLSSANLSSANLRYANLSSANLRYANLRYANLRYADLSYANLRYADLSYAINTPKILNISPIGSRNDCLCAVIIEGKLEVSTGCFSGTISEFADAVKSKHGGSNFGKDYTDAIVLIKRWAKRNKPAKSEKGR